MYLKNQHENSEETWGTQKIVVKVAGISEAARNVISTQLQNSQNPSRGSYRLL